MKKHIVLLVAASAALGVLSGCGGGGGGSSTSALPTNPEEFVDVIDPDAAADAERRAALSTPRSGSVTQSSNRGSSTDTTTDRISVTVEPLPSDPDIPVVTIENTPDEGSNSRLKMIESRQSDIPFDPEAGSIFDKGILMARRMDGGFLVSSVVYKNIGSIDPYTDYLVAGIWGWIPDSSILSEAEIGAFADGEGADFTGDIPALTGTARYEGEAGGVYTFSIGGESTPPDLLRGDVVLTANFDTNLIGGHFDPANDDGERINIPVGAPGGRDLRIEFGDAPLTNEFFEGDIDAPTSFSGSGKWGGQFYGDPTDGQSAPAYAAGTFSGSFEVSASDGQPSIDVGYTGAFITER